MYTLARLEETGLSTWLRESGPAFFTSLTLHSLAMALVVGINIALALRLAGLTPAFALPPLSRFLTLHWIAALVILASGLALLLAYPAKALTNPVFYLKLVCLLVALGLTWRLQKSLGKPGQVWEQPGARWLATAILLLWTLVLFTGRFLAYTNSILLASSFY